MLKEVIQYRGNDYFNDEDYYILFDISLKKYYITKIEMYNGSWYTKHLKSYSNETYYTKGRWYDSGAPNFKMTSIPCINCNEIYGVEVKYKNTEIRGKITTWIFNNLGIFWNGKMNYKEYRKYGIPLFWNEMDKLEILEPL